MIQITHRPQYHQITIEGHAQSAPKGEDLVCAGVSTIFHTLTANAMGWKELGYLRDLRLQEIDGYAQISWIPNSRWKNILDAIADGVCKGFEILARDYPEYVRFERYG
jgi:uncharacterized protein YsxB (DUF464 family)